MESGLKGRFFYVCLQRTLRLFVDFGPVLLL